MFFFFHNQRVRVRVWRICFHFSQITLKKKDFLFLFVRFRFIGLIGREVKLTNQIPLDACIKKCAWFAMIRDEFFAPLHWSHKDILIIVNRKWLQKRQLPNYKLVVSSLESVCFKLKCLHWLLRTLWHDECVIGRLVTRFQVYLCLRVCVLCALLAWSRLCVVCIYCHLYLHLQHNLRPKEWHSSCLLFLWRNCVGGKHNISFCFCCFAIL